MQQFGAFGFKIDPLDFLITRWQTHIAFQFFFANLSYTIFSLVIIIIIGMVLLRVSQRHGKTSS